MATIKTSELALAAKLMRAFGKLAPAKGFEKRTVRGREVLDFIFEGDADKLDQLVNEYRTGVDGITQYETCRKMLMRIIDTEIDYKKRERMHHGPEGKGKPGRSTQQGG